MIRVVHFRQKCIGCNACAELFPARWRMSKKDGKSRLLAATEKKDHYLLVAGEDEKEAFMASAANCPVKIIRVESLIFS